LRFNLYHDQDIFHADVFFHQDIFHADVFFHLYTAAFQSGVFCEEQACNRAYYCRLGT